MNNQPAVICNTEEELGKDQFQCYLNMSNCLTLVTSMKNVWPQCLRFELGVGDIYLV